MSKKKKGGRAWQGGGAWDYGYDWADDKWSGDAWGSGGRKESDDDLEELPFSRLNYESYNFGSLLERMLRRDQDMCTKFERFARKAWQSTLKTSNSTGGPMQQRVEGFVHDWIQDTLGRCWQSILSSFEEESRLAGSMAAEIFSQMCRRMKITGSEEKWQIAPTSCVIGRAVRQTWPDYFPKVRCDIDDWQPGVERVERGTPVRDSRTPDKEEDRFSEPARDSGARGEAVRSVDRSRSRSSSRHARRSLRSPSIGPADRPKGKMLLSPRDSKAVDAIRGEQPVSGRNRSGSKSPPTLAERKPPLRKQAKPVDEEVPPLSRRKVAANAAPPPLLRTKTAGKRRPAAVTAAPAPVAAAAQELAAAGATIGAGRGEDDEDFDDEMDDDTLMAMMAQAMGEPAEVDKDKASEEEPPIETVEQALKILESSTAPKGVSGCGSAEACAGGFRDRLHRFEGFDDHVYCATCCKMLSKQYPALKSAKMIQHR